MGEAGYRVSRPAVLVVREGFLRVVDPALSELTGLSHGELRAVPWEELVHPEDRPRVRECLADCLAGREPHGPVSFRLLHRDGHALPAVTCLSRVELDGEPAVLLHLRFESQPETEDYARLFAAVSDLVLTHDAEGESSA